MHVPPKAFSHDEMVGVGAHVHCAVVGMPLGSGVGAVVGVLEGKADGPAVGLDVGAGVGVLEGKADGAAVGLDDGDEVGAGDGTGDGTGVGSRFVKTQSGRLMSSSARTSDPFPDCSHTQVRSGPDCPHTLQARSASAVPLEIDR